MVRIIMAIRYFLQPLLFTFFRQILQLVTPVMVSLLVKPLARFLAFAMIKRLCPQQLIEEKFMPTEQEVVKSIENVKLIITAVASAGNLAGKVYADGKIDAADLSSVPEFLMALVPSLTTVKFGEISAEVSNLTDAEIAEILVHFNTVFNIPEDKIETNIESILGLVKDAVGIVTKVIAIIKGSK